MPGERRQELRQLLHFALAFVLLRDPAAAPQLGPGRGKQRAEMHICIRLWKKTALQKARGSRDLYVDLDLRAEGPW